MAGKIVRWFKSRPFLSVSVSVLVLATLIVGLAAIIGAFGGGDRTALNEVPDDSLNNALSPDSLKDNPLTIIPTDSDSLGVSPLSAFKLIFEKAADEKLLATSLTVEPGQEYSLEKISDREYEVKFAEPLEKDKIYNFILNDKKTGSKFSYAFQTKKSFSVIRTLPRNQSVQVPLNSGIEITFSHENFEEPEKYFEISPKANGRFEIRKKTLIFIPDKLEESTVYTVTVKKGLKVSGSSETLENDYTFRFQTVAPQEINERSYYFEFSNTLYNFTPESVPTLEVFASQELSEREIIVDLYSYPDSESFLKDLELISDKPFWAWYKNRDKIFDETKLSKAAKVNARIITRQKTYWTSSHLLLPSSLPEGYYLVKAEIDGEKYYTHLQINKTSVYIMTTRNKALAWVNDSETGKPLAGARIRRSKGIKEAVTGNDGIAVLDDILPSLSDVTYHHYIVEPSSGMTFIAQLGNNYYQPFYSYNSSETINNYWAYIYTDKGIYLPEDTVNVWGILRPRDGSKLSGVTLEVIRYDYSYEGESRETVLTSEKVGISPYGTFTGSLKLSNFNPGSYEVRLNAGGKPLLTSYFMISDYTKPAYRIDIEPDRNYMYAWEKVRFNINTSFYEGTPVSNVMLSYFLNVGESNQSNGVLTSDAQGMAGISVSPKVNVTDWRPVYLFFNVRNHDAEEQEINAYSSVFVFPKDTMIEVETNGKKGSATIVTSRIDLDRLSGKPAEYYSEDEYRGEPVDMPVTVKLFERHFEKKVKGQYYDHINKVNQEIYEYHEVTNLVREFSARTVRGKLEVNFDIDDDKNYFMEVHGKDSAGRDITETRYLYDWNYYSPFNTSTYYIAEGNLYKRYSKGEKVSVEVKFSKETEPSAGTPDHGRNKYLFVRLKNGIIDYTIRDSSVYEFEYGENMTPNMYVKAVCFDGTNVYDAGLRQYTFDSKEKQLNISVSADKDSYRPGDTVKLTFDVKDINGRPKKAEINVSVIDESYFAVSHQKVDLLSSLYTPIVSSGILSDYVSYSAAGESGVPMAEGGEGGDLAARSDFRDSALFATIESGDDGKAEASFKLPDNLTSWRVTYQAVTEDLEAGSGKINISSRLPFFVSTIFNKNFITGDKPSILVRAYGTAVTASSEVSYKVTLKNDRGFEKTFMAKGYANTITEIPLTALEPGSYTAIVEGLSGELKDAIEQKFRVSDSLLETASTDYLDLSAGIVLPGNTKGLTTLTFYNRDSSLLYNELQSLRWSWGQRLDQKLARKISQELLKKRFNEEPYFDEEFDISEYQAPDGGLAILSYDYSDPALSAKMAALAGDFIDKSALAAYFRSILDYENSLQEDVAYALWGLAALKEPVLLDIRNLLDNEDLSTDIKLILGVALAQIGDYQGAGEIYIEAMSESGKITDTFAFLERSTRDGTIESTALCSLIAMYIDAPEKIKLFNYVKSNSTEEILVNLERLIFVTNYTGYPDSVASFTYELDGAKKRIELKNGSCYSLVLTPDKLSSIRFSDVNGNVTLSMSYVAPVSELEASQDNLVSLSRSYSVEETETNSFSRSDLIKITLTPSFSVNAPDGYYEITDILPSGLRYVYNRLDQWNTYPDEVSGQKVVFGFYYDKKQPEAKSIVYYARAATPGTYTADNAAIRHSDSSVAGFAGKTTVTVNN